jgi:4-diphosphocytidyl-2-C-methyl-D-erythritol kinase
VTVAAAANGHRVRVRIPAKINLFLSVRGTRPDGYHELVSVMQTVTLHDTVVAQLDDDPVAAHPAARRLMALAFSLEGPTTVPPDEDNLAVKAARSLMDALGIGTVAATCNGAVPRTRLHLRKRIPVAAGMAGGSADAAAALLALNHLWQADLDRDDLRELGAELGPTCRSASPAGRRWRPGRGPRPRRCWPAAPTTGSSGDGPRRCRRRRSTARSTRSGAPSTVEPDAVLQALRTGDAEALGAALHNDLEVAARTCCRSSRPSGPGCWRRGRSGCIVSGSGPTLARAGSSAQHACAWRRRWSATFDRVEIALSPAGGPDGPVRVSAPSSGVRCDRWPVHYPALPHPPVVRLGAPVAVGGGVIGNTPSFGVGIQGSIPCPPAT